MDAKGRGYMEGLPFRGLAIFIQTVKDVYFTKGVLLALFFLMIPPLISVYTLANSQEGFKEWWNLFAVFGLVLYLQLLVLLYSLVYGSSMINENMDNRTMTYLTIRSAKRFEIVIWKYVGLVFSVQLMFTFSIIVTYLILGSHGPVSEIWSNIGILLILLFTVNLGIAVYVALFSMFGTAFKHPLMVGILFAFFWEVIMVYIPANVKMVTIMHYLQSIFRSNRTISEAIDLGDSTGSVFSTTFLVVLSVVFLSFSIYILTRKDVN
jgi:ABC-type transport system involved in multi-copper enzyme maturation permease subunit